MTDLLGMGGYGAYVWAAYAVFFLALAVDTLAPVLHRRRSLNDLRARLRREAARKAARKNP